MFSNIPGYVQAHPWASMTFAFGAGAATAGGLFLGLDAWENRKLEEVPNKVIEKLNNLNKEFASLAEKNEPFPTAKLYMFSRELRNTNLEPKLAIKAHKVIRCIELLDAHYRGDYMLPNVDDIHSVYDEACQRFCEHKSEKTLKKEAKKAEKEAKKAKKEAA